MAKLRASLIALGLLAAGARAQAPAPPIEFTGLGWVEYGRIGHTTVVDTAATDYTGNSIQSSGAQLSLSAHLNDRLAGAVGLGVVETHAMAGQLRGGGRSPARVGPYIAEARFTYVIGDRAAPRLQVTGGLFPYNYNPEVKDLGLYLLRGPVYPGIVISGFETTEVLPIANILGLWLRNVTGPLRSDLLLVSETELKPYFDLSLAYIARVKASEWLSFGAGVDFYHLIPSDAEVTRRPYNPDLEPPESNVHNPFQRTAIYVDSSGGKPDTTYLGFDGTKIMANLEFDPKPLLGGAGLGPLRLGQEDLKLYAEAAVIGLDFDKAHEALYGGLAQRIPMMAGFNLPAFGYLDHLSLEVEWYGAPFRDDLERLVAKHQDPRSPIPYTTSKTSAVSEVYRDEYKWALHAAKTLEGHFRISAQAANDHLRPGGTKVQTYEAALTTPEDWYWMAKIAYFF